MVRSTLFPAFAALHNFSWRTHSLETGIGGCTTSAGSTRFFASLYFSRHATHFINPFLSFLSLAQGLGMGLGRGMGRCYGMFKSEGQAIIAGCASVTAIGALLTTMWYAYIGDRIPRTFTPAWQKATAKYRAAQNQDPISNM